VVGAITVAAVAGVVALAISACSGDDKPAPPTSPASTSASSSPGASSGALTDESAAVLAWTPPAPVARTAGKLAARSGQEKSPTVPATAEIVSVQASDASTILTWQLSSSTDLSAQGLTLNSIHGARFWPDAVRLVDPAGKKSYAVNTMDVDTNTYCVCSAYPIHVGADPVRMTSEYPPLPATVTSVSVRIPNFAPVTVPVTR
jgi:ABC-type glycerol-3-phosphate transport system substrate-binding protein